MKKIVEADTIEKHSVEEYVVDKVEVDVRNVEFQNRAFSELMKNDVVDDTDYRGFNIRYTAEPHTDNILDSKFAVFDNGIGYLSWIWVSKTLRGMGIGTELVQQTLRVMREKDAKEVYTLAKSPEAQHIFTENYGFDSCDSIPGNWYRKSIEGI